jgi:hypothetical protein
MRSKQLAEDTAEEVMTYEAIVSIDSSESEYQWAKSRVREAASQSSCGLTKHRALLYLHMAELSTSERARRILLAIT